MNAVRTSHYLNLYMDLKKVYSNASYQFGKLDTTALRAFKRNIAL